jgi:hypothetical protein
LTSTIRLICAAIAAFSRSSSTFLLALGLRELLRQCLEVDATQVDLRAALAHRRRAADRAHRARHRSAEQHLAKILQLPAWCSSRILSASANTVATRGAKPAARGCGFSAP